MSKSPQYWVFSNKHEGAYKENAWDMATILRRKRYSIRETEMNRASIRPGDVVYMRIFGMSFIGTFNVSGPWKRCPERQQKWKATIGEFPMSDIKRWPRAVPQNLILPDLSNRNHRRRIVKISKEDSTLIDTAQRLYQRLGFGRGDRDVLILEKGLEEAIKPSLRQLGLELAEKKICQQFSMDVGAGRSDLICYDARGDFVVIELKRGMTSDKAIGQVSRYIGWIKEKLAKPKQKVHGWIMTGDYDERLRLAASAVGIKLVLVRLA